MAQFAVTGKPAAIRCRRASRPGAIYDVFETKDDSQVFIAVVSDTQWRAFCEAFEQSDLAADASLASNSQRVAERDRLIPKLREIFRSVTRSEIGALCEQFGLGFAPITRPHELFEDPQLNRPDAMVEVTLPDGRTSPLPALPLEMDGRRLKRRLDVPRLGEHSAAIAQELGIDRADIDALQRDGIIGKSGG